MGEGNNTVAGSVLVSRKYILPNLQHPSRQVSSFDNEETEAEGSETLLRVI